MDVMILGTMNDSQWKVLKGDKRWRERQIHSAERGMYERRLTLETQFQDTILSVYHVENYSEKHIKWIEKADLVIFMIPTVGSEKRAFNKAWRFMFGAMNSVDNPKGRAYVIFTKGEVGDWIEPYTYNQPVPVQYLLQYEGLLEKEAFNFEHRYFGGN